MALGSVENGFEAGLQFVQANCYDPPTSRLLGRICRPIRLSPERRLVGLSHTWYYDTASDVALPSAEHEFCHMIGDERLILTSHFHLDQDVAGEAAQAMLAVMADHTVGALARRTVPEMVKASEITHAPWVAICLEHAIIFSPSDPGARIETHLSLSHTIDEDLLETTFRVIIDQDITPDDLAATQRAVQAIIDTQVRQAMRDDPMLHDYGLSFSIRLVPAPA